MLPFLRALHVVCVALWFGSVAFFTIAGVVIFQAFNEVSHDPAARGMERWLPPPAFVSQGERPEGLPELTRERGSRLAGVAVSQIFFVYYALQAVCAIVALATALLLARSGEGAAHGTRILLCVLALGSVAGGWWLEHEVSELRQPRNELTDQALAEAKPSTDLVARAVAARATFARWHGYSLIQNFATLGLVLVLTLLVPSVSAPPRGSP